MQFEISQPRISWQLSFIITATIFFTPEFAQASTFDTPVWQTAGATFEAGRFPITVQLVDANLPDTLSANDLNAALSDAITEWNNVGCTDASLTLLDTVDSVSDANADVPIVFINDSAEICFPFKGDLGFTLYTECGSYTPRTILLNREDFVWQTEPDPFNQVDGEAVDLQSVLTHELGHALGLSHDQTDPLAAMTPRYLSDGGLSSLAASDKAALCELYSNGQNECETNADCPFECVAIGQLNVCQERRADIGEHCAVDEAVCSTCLISSPETFSGYCTTECTTDDDCESLSSCNDENLCEFNRRPELPDGGCAAVKSYPTLVTFLFALYVLANTRKRRHERNRAT